MKKKNRKQWLVIIQKVVSDNNIKNTKQLKEYSISYYYAFNKHGLSKEIPLTNRAIKNRETPEQAVRSLVNLVNNNNIKYLDDLKKISPKYYKIMYKYKLKDILAITSRFVNENGSKIKKQSRKRMSFDDRLVIIQKVVDDNNIKNSGELREYSKAHYIYLQKRKALGAIKWQQKSRVGRKKHKYIDAEPIINMLFYPNKDLNNNVVKEIGNTEEKTLPFTKRGW